MTDYRGPIYCETNSLVYGELPLNFATYRKTSNISRTLVGNKIVDNSM